MLETNGLINTTYSNLFVHAPYYYITLNLTNACNKDCSYCVNKYLKMHDTTEEQYNIPDDESIHRVLYFIRELSKRIDKPLLITLTGGEPTLLNLHKILEELLTIKKVKYIVLFTNFSQPTKYYEDLVKNYLSKFKNYDLLLSAQTPLPKPFNDYIMFNKQQGSHVKITVVDSDPILDSIKDKKIIVISDKTKQSANIFHQRHYCSGGITCLYIEQETVFTSACEEPNTFLGKITGNNKELIHKICNLRDKPVICNLRKSAVCSEYNNIVLTSSITEFKDNIDKWDWYGKSWYGR